MSAELLDPDRTAVVVVDLQEKLLPAISERERVLRNGVLLLRLADALGLPVLLTTQYARGLGRTVEAVTEAAPGAQPIDKVSFGCFGSPEFLERLGTLAGRNQLLVAGIESHICVAQTVLGALGRGYQVHVAADAVGLEGLGRLGEQRTRLQLAARAADARLAVGDQRAVQRKPVLEQRQEAELDRGRIAARAGHELG